MSAEAGRLIVAGGFLMSARNAILVVAAAAGLSAFTLPAGANTFMLDNAAVGVSGDQMTLVRLPIVTPKGDIIYKDVTIKFRLNARRNLVLVPGFPKSVLSPRLVAGNLRPGVFHVRDSTHHKFELSGPVPGPNSRGMWTLVGVGSNSYEMTFYAGQIAGHPMEERIKAAGIKPSAAIYGIVANIHCSYLACRDYDRDALVSVTSVNGNLRLDSYTKSGKDTDLPIASTTLRRP